MMSAQPAETTTVPTESASTVLLKTTNFTMDFVSQSLHVEQDNGLTTMENVSRLVQDATLSTHQAEFAQAAYKGTTF